MTRRDEQPQDNATARDGRVSELYAQAGQERAGDQLDRQVLKLAARNAAASGAGGRLPAWLRPTAAVLTVALSLGLLLQVDWSPDGSALPVADDDGVGANVVTEFQEAAEGSSERIRSIGNSASSVQPQGDPTAAALPAASEQPAADRGSCNAEQTRSPERWQSCIERLRREGRTDAANRELARFERRFPELADTP